MKYLALSMLLAFAAGMLTDGLVADARHTDEQQALVDEVYAARREAELLTRLVVAIDADCGAPAGTPQPLELPPHQPARLLSADAAGPGATP